MEVTSIDLPPPPLLPIPMKRKRGRPRRIPVPRVNVEVEEIVESTVPIQPYYHPRHYQHMFASYRNALLTSIQRQGKIPHIIPRLDGEEEEEEDESSSRVEDEEEEEKKLHAGRSEEAIALEHSRHPALFLEEKCHRSLYASQQELIRRMAILKHIILIEKMGLGKTAALLQHRLEMAQARVMKGLPRFGHPTLIVVSKLLINQWRDEIAKGYSRQAMTVEVIHVSTLQSARDAILQVDLDRILNCIDVVLTTYDSIKSVHDILKAADKEGQPRPNSLLSLDFDCVILDEGSVLTNEATKIFAICAKIKARQRILVSATPFPNAMPSEVLAVLNFVAPDRPPSLEEMRGDLITVELAAALARPYLLYVTPPVLDRPIREQWLSFCNDYERESYLELQKRGAMGKDIRMYWTMWNRKFCVSVNLLEEAGQRQRSRDAVKHPSTKISWILMFEKNTMPAGDCALIYNEFVEPLQEVAYYLKKAGIPFALLHSGLSEPVKQRLIQVCLHPSKDDVPFRFILLSSRLGGAGLDGLQRRASVVILLQPLWNYSLCDQSCGRIDRPGQLKKPEFFVLIMIGTVEEHMWNITQAKKRDAKILMGLA